MNRLGVTAELARFCAMSAERAAWLDDLPRAMAEFAERWRLTIGTAYAGATCAWVARVKRADGSDAVLKLAMPHLEAEGEIEGLRFWNGDPTVRLIDADDSRGALLIERCEPGTTLHELPEEQQDVVIADLLKRGWREGPEGRFRPLAEMLEHWRAETIAQQLAWSDSGLVREGLRLLEELPKSAEARVLFTDLHAGNVLRAQRAPWLAIDPKPFVGERAYDATQHLFNCGERMRKDARGTIRRFADLIEVEEERVRLWMFARGAAEPRENWADEWTELARGLM